MICWVISNICGVFKNNLYMKLISLKENTMHAGVFSHQVDGRIVSYSLQCNKLKECMVFCMSGEGRKFARMKQLSHFTEFALTWGDFFFLFLFPLVFSLPLLARRLIVCSTLSE